LTSSQNYAEKLTINRKVFLKFLDFKGLFDRQGKSPKNLYNTRGDWWWVMPIKRGNNGARLNAEGRGADTGSELFA
jgi:hypothetical protein